VGKVDFDLDLTVESYLTASIRWFHGFQLRLRLCCEPYIAEKCGQSSWKFSSSSRRWV